MAVGRFDPAAGLIDDGQYTKRPSIGQRIVDEIHAPALGGTIRYRRGAAMQGDVFPSTDSHPQLQAVQPIQPPHPLSYSPLLLPGRVMSVPIQPGTTFSVGNPQLVFDGPYLAPNSARTYDVSLNGERFLMIKDAASPLKTSAPPSIIVVQGWFEKLRRRVPTD